ncbi:hypothetical protein AaE_004534, partial [Aphanomyces astaci]
MVRTREKEKIADMVARHGIRPRAPAPTIPTTRHTHNDSSRMPFALTRGEIHQHEQSTFPTHMSWHSPAIHPNRVPEARFEYYMKCDLDYDVARE